MANFTYSSTGLALTQKFEGLKLNAYQDQVGVWTIGYGHTGPTIHAGLIITQDQADHLLHRDIAASRVPRPTRSSVSTKASGQLAPPSVCGTMSVPRGPFEDLPSRKRCASFFTWASLAVT